MEYMILTLPLGTTSAEEALNQWAKEGWTVICALAEYRLVLGRPVNEIKTYYKE